MLFKECSTECSKGLTNWNWSTGDRHPSNLMLDKVSGRVLHIDFGDCFEIAMVRDKYPERVPFRLTRMLVKAMEVSGIEGSYRSTCERTMAVLRSNRDSLVAMLEAFVHDPLISWRLVDLSATEDNHSSTESVVGSADDLSDGVEPVGEALSDAPTAFHAALEAHTEEEDAGGNDNDNGDDAEGPQDDRDTLTSLPPRENDQRQGHGKPESDGVAARSASRARSLKIHSEMQSLAARRRADSRIASITAGVSESVQQQEVSLARSRIERSMKQRELLKVLGGKDGTAHEYALNRKALKVIRRVEDKLNGTDFPDCEEESLDVPDQVQRLIVQATSTENLCQLFIGWCAFW